MAINAEYEARKATLSDVGLLSSLTYKEFLHSISGFRSLLSFPGGVFTCPSCTSKPPYIAFDGTDVGPAKKTVEHLSEMDQPGGEDLLSQGSTFEDRTFLQMYQERELVFHLARGTLEIEDFMEGDMRSENGQLVKQLVARIYDNFSDLPPPYQRFLLNISKETPVAGLLQVTQPEPLKILKRFANQSLDLLSARNIESLNLVKIELPPFWDMLKNIIELEKNAFLPPDVACIVLRLLDIRKRTFREAVKRSQSDYTEWDELRDHPLMYYPDYPLRQYPQRYNIKSRSDPDRCVKEMRESRRFVEGIMTAGCTCSKNITVGFELMLNSETPFNPFRFLMCR